MKNKAEREQLNYELKDTLAGALYYAWGTERALENGWLTAEDFDDETKGSLAEVAGSLARIAKLIGA